MKQRCQKTVTYLTFFLSIIAFSSFGQEQHAKSVRDGVLLHISHGTDSPHRLLMGLKMAVTMAEAGNDVLVYCDIEAVKVLVTDAKAVTLENFPSSDELFNRLKELGVQVLACPTCMKVAHIDAKDLRPGVSVVQKDLFFSFTKGRILSLDY